ncbi:F0F1 ATP synthase subunit epsilon [Candidatus Aquiluna sp. UB-MaderosW2red]|uniref:F0F1 ATP synthase subunit epsilon n=1 Tax=Candidatus Aquiluna sp. UB-MaderosW2red TaxID=1855377 RepID=UPI000875ADE0|nr:F0F1 ATP synthase subunit epsilon [Candidatus Aquiluna sp. UB-MaderosW2red]SCX13825.1 F-type H+-transporting ATPase subunit epsilon [Candidatus Aquiluna sp. UB-MaderosW2red]
MANLIQVSLVSQDSPVWSGEATMVVAKTTVGEIGLLAGHEPFLAILTAGEIRITTDSGVIKAETSEGGFLSMENNIVTVVVRDAHLVK